MRKEDRKPSKRVFPLLQNLDLDTVTFANVQGVGDSITIEDMNEQELQDLVLVNLARLVVSGEWTGLLEAGGGGGTLGMYTTGTNAAHDEYNVTLVGPYGGGYTSEASWATSEVFEPRWYPFIGPFTGNVAQLSVSLITSGSPDLVIGIYTDDGASAGLPDTLIGKATIDCSSTGNLVATSFVDGDGSAVDIALVVGTRYWIGYCKTASDTLGFVCQARYSYAYTGLNAVPNEGSLQGQTIMDETVGDGALPATVTPANLVNDGGAGTFTGRVVVTLR